MSEIETRFLREVGTRAYLRVFWGETKYENGALVHGDCANGYGRGGPGIHNAQIWIADSSTIADWEMAGSADQYPRASFPTKCDHCDAVVPPEPARIPCDCGTPNCTRAPSGAPQYQVHRRRLYEPSSGDRRVRDEFEGGDMYWGDWYGCSENGPCPAGWTNCSGKHLMIELPNGRIWDVGSRASNCTLPEDTEHRCWVLEGDPERDRITVSKSGKTCSAGGGSIQAGDYHGVLTSGVLRKC